MSTTQTWGHVGGGAWDPTQSIWDEKEREGERLRKLNWSHRNGDGCGGAPPEFDEQPQPDVQAAPPATPIDLWGKFNPPILLRDALPTVIEHFAFAQGELMGADPAGLAIGALVVCAAAIPDCVELQVKQHDISWRESARLWAVLVGPPSTKKSPTLRQVARPLVRMDGELARKYAMEKAEYDKLTADERRNTEPPKKKRMRIEDTTIESAQEILRDSPRGVLSLQDELSGWFGAIDKYTSVRGSHKDRAFWLQSWNGGEYVSDRINRGQCYILNLSVSLLGGIQPETLRKVIDDTVDDGLIQRANPVILRAAVAGKDEDRPAATRAYEQLVERLAGKQQLGGIRETEALLVKFSPEAQAVRQRLENRNIDLMTCDAVYPKLGAHLGKYDGMFARLCLIWHCIEARWIDNISESVALRVEKFLYGFLLPHAVAFYSATAHNTEHDPVAGAAGHILAHRLEVITNRDLARSGRVTKGLSRLEAADIFERLEALGWVSRIQGPRPNLPASVEGKRDLSPAFCGKSSRREGASTKGDQNHAGVARR